MPSSGSTTQRSRRSARTVCRRRRSSLPPPPGSSRRGAARRAQREPPARRRRRRPTPDRSGSTSSERRGRSRRTGHAARQPPPRRPPERSRAGLARRTRSSPRFYRISPRRTSTGRDGTPRASQLAIISARMRTAETVAGLAAFDRRGAGTDAERRAAPLAPERAQRREQATSSASRSGAGRTGPSPTPGTPGSASRAAWSSVESARIGGALVLVALLSVIADALTGLSLGRRLDAERASQNVVVAARTTTVAKDRRVRLVITANYDAGRGGIAYWNRPRRAAARIRR